MNQPLLPSELINDFLRQIRSQFCGDLDPKTWGQYSHFLKREVITWPAAFMRAKGFELPLERYKLILQEILLGVKRHGDTGRINYWPGYLQKCVREHFQLHWEEYYQEAKSARALSEKLLAGLKATTSSSDQRQTDTLAEVHQALRSKKQKRKPVAKQLAFLGLALALQWPFATLEKFSILRHFATFGPFSIKPVASAFFCSESS